MAEKALRLKPIWDHVIVKPIEQEQVTKSGIVIPDTVSKEKPKCGKVLAVGDGKVENGQKITSPVKVGDIVYFTQYAPTEIKVDDEELYIISFSSLLAVEVK